MSFDIPTVRLLRVALATNITQFGVRPVDIEVAAIGCVGSPGPVGASGTEVAFTIEVARAYGGPVTFAMSSYDYWSGVYAALNQGSPALFPEEDGFLRFSEDGSVPVSAEDDGSGSGSGLGEP